MRAVFLAMAVFVAPALGFAQTTTMPGMNHDAMPATSGGAGDASTKAYQDAMEKMHQQMVIPYTGNPDQDFVSGMMPHHQGAVDMAKIELQYGHDPALRKLAHNIIAAQDKEIAFMQAWQAKHPK